MALLSTLYSQKLVVLFIFALCNAGKCKIKYEWGQEVYIWILQNSLLLFISNGTAKQSWQFLYSGEFVKSFSVQGGTLYVTAGWMAFTLSQSVAMTLATIDLHAY